MNTRILIIDDDPRQARALSRVVEKQGYTPEPIADPNIVALTTKVTYRLADQMKEPSDFILLDMQMGGNDAAGGDLYCSIDPELRKCGGPVIAVSKTYSEPIEAFVQTEAGGRFVPIGSETLTGASLREIVERYSTQS